MRASFLFVGDLKGHHREWLGTTTTNRHGVAAFDFARVFGCVQLVFGHTHACGGTVDNLMTDVPGLVRVEVVTSIGNWDHPSLLAVVSKAQAAPSLSVSRNFFMKHPVNWNTVCGAIQGLPWHNIWSPDIPIECQKD